MLISIPRRNAFRFSRISFPRWINFHQIFDVAECSRRLPLPQCILKQETLKLLQIPQKRGDPSLWNWSLSCDKITKPLLVINRNRSRHQKIIFQDTKHCYKHFVKMTFFFTKKKYIFLLILSLYMNQNTSSSKLSSSNMVFDSPNFA